MFGIGGGELVAIVLIALIVLGPERIPGVARSLARIYREFTRVRKQAGSAVEDIRKELQLDDALRDEDDAPRLRPPAGERAERPRISLDQLAVSELEQQQAQQEAARPSSGFMGEPLPVPELDDYLGQPEAAARPAEPRS